MNYLQFRKQWFDLACIQINQIYAWDPNFDRNNLTRWQKRKLLVKLRQGYYTFPEYMETAGIAWFFANRMYTPSYISLHTALAFYGIIPESVVQITSITTLKTASFKNEFGEFSYKNVQQDLFFGYELKQVHNNKMLQFASPEKALLDLLYLYPFYNTVQEMLDLRLDEDYLANDLNLEIFFEYLAQYKNKSLESRVKIFIKAYQL